MPQVDVIDESFLVAAPARVAALLRDPDRCRAWWPDLRLSIFADRGDEGVRWNVTGALVGSMEVWLEAYGDGVIAHYYLRADFPRAAEKAAPAASGLTSEEPATSEEGRRRDRRRRAAKRSKTSTEIHRRQRAVKAVFWRLKDELEAGRAPGEPRCAELPAG